MAGAMMGSSNTSNRSDGADRDPCESKSFEERHGTGSYHVDGGGSSGGGGGGGGGGGSGGSGDGSGGGDGGGVEGEGW